MRVISKDEIVCKLFLVLIFIYYSQSVIFTGLSFIGQPVLLLMLVISLYYGNKYFQKKSDYISKTILLFIIVQTFWILFTLMFTTNDIGINQYKAMLLNFLPFFTFRYFSEKKILKRKYLEYFLYAILPIFIYKLITNSAELRLTKFNQDTIVDNTIYYFVGLLPFVLLIKNKIISFLVLLVFWYYIIESAKRGAVICGVLTMVIYFFLIFHAKKKNVLDKLLKNSFYSIIIVAVIYFAYNTLMQNEFLISRLEKMMDGDSSGRDDIAVNAINHWLEDGKLIRMFFGSGYNSIQLITGHVSHNDWLDMISSFGLFGLFIYSLLYFVLIRFLFVKKMTIENKLLLILYISIAILTSFTSRWYWATFSYTQMLLLPYILTTSNFIKNENSSIR